MLDQLNIYDWEAVFKYASPTLCKAQHVHGPASTITSVGVSLASFTREDVHTIIGLENGENDGAAWIGLFQLKDGRFAFIGAGCDYSGWG
jgi:hypothetical protein